jgi:hypothetical protein
MSGQFFIVPFNLVQRLHQLFDDGTVMPQYLIIHDYSAFTRLALSILSMSFCAKYNRPSILEYDNKPDSR